MSISERVMVLLSIHTVVSNGIYYLLSLLKFNKQLGLLEMEGLLMERGR